MLLPLSFVFGVLTHLLFFIRGERHLYPIRYVLWVAFLYTSGATLLYRTHTPSLSLASLAAAVATSVYLLGIYASLLTYRLVFHPARYIPGPLALRISDLAFSFMVGKLDSGDKLIELHEKYGEIVRIGSNSVSITAPSGPRLVYGQESKCTKAAWYDLALPNTSMMTFRDRESHARRRRVWSSAFSDRALRSYEKRLAPYISTLLDRLSAQDGKPTNITELTSHYSWDITSDLAFGESFKMLESSPNATLVEIQKDANIPLGWLLPVWMYRFFISLPGLSADWQRWMNFIELQTEKRLNNKPAIPDIFECFVKHLQGRQPTQEDLELMRGDANLVLGAGSDTSATTLAYALYSLAVYPQQAERLRAEIRDAVPVSNHFNLSSLDLQNLPHLNAIINETLRLYPAVPAHIFRTTPFSGLQIDPSTFIPGGIDVMCPQWAINRSERMYDQPLCWIPERWTTQRDLVRFPDSFLPFSAGPTGCIGRPLALMNLRLVIANIVMHFDIRLPKDGSPDVVGKCLHVFTLKPPVFNLNFVARL